MKRTCNCLSRLHRDQDGSFSLSNMAILVFLCVLSMLLINVAASLIDRADLQRKADAAAISLTNQKARYSNSVVSLQHLMGEINALTIVHHAIGGELLDKNLAANTARQDARLRSAYRAARALGYRCPAYPNVSSPVLAGEALLEAQIELKALLTTDYYLLVTAWLLKRFWFTRPVGIVLERVALLLEAQIHFEWRVLDRVRQLARSLTPVKQQLLNALRLSKRQLDLLVAEYPLAQKRLADELESRFRIKIHVLPSDRLLPLQQDPWSFRTTVNGSPAGNAKFMRERIVKITQLTRATFPWVNYHRAPLVSSLRALSPLSRMGNRYFAHTVQVCQRFCNELQLNDHIALYVLSDYMGPDKAFEPWVQSSGSHSADRSFGLTVLVGESAAKPVGEKLFERALPSHNYRVATGMIWNRHAPKQSAFRINLHQNRLPTMQAKTGWDTLNWSPGRDVPEFADASVPNRFPAIAPGWAANLSPTSPARWEQLKLQPLPSWAQAVEDVLPLHIGPEFIGP